MKNSFLILIVAKENNLAWRDKSKTDYISLCPCFGSLHNENIPVGLTFKFRFLIEILIFLMPVSKMDLLDSKCDPHPE